MRHTTARPLTPTSHARILALHARARALTLQRSTPTPHRSAALVREVHVYGQLIATHDKAGSAAQHVGLGRRLLAEAERRARAHGCRRVAVIAGVGSRGFYRKSGYELDSGDGQFMMKSLGLFAPGWSEALAASPRARALSRIALAGLAAAAALWLLHGGECAEEADGAGLVAGLAPAACLATTLLV